MNSVNVKLTMPGFFVNSLDLRQDELEEYIRQTLSVELYREGKLSLGKAKELAGLSNKWEMVQLLNSRGVCFDYTAEDAEKDLESLNSL